MKTMLAAVLAALLSGAAPAALAQGLQSGGADRLQHPRNPSSRLMSRPPPAPPQAAQATQAPQPPQASAPPTAGPGFRDRGGELRASPERSRPRWRGDGGMAQPRPGPDRRSRDLGQADGRSFPLGEAGPVVVSPPPEGTAGLERRDERSAESPRARKRGWVIERDRRVRGGGAPDTDRRHRWERRRYPPIYVSPWRYYGSSWYPPSGFYARSWSYGDFLPDDWYGPRRRILDWWDYGLPEPPPGHVWVRIDDDALLVDSFTGRIVQVVRHVFW